MPRVRLPMLDVLVALVLVVAAVVTRDDVGRAPDVVVALYGAAWMAAFALRSVATLPMTVWITLGLVGYLPLTGGHQFPVWVFAAALWGAFSIGSQLDGPRRWVAALVFLAGPIASTLARQTTDRTFADRWVSPLVIVFAPMAAGALLRRFRRQSAELRTLTAELAGEREAHAAEAAVAERDRIARELHDVIAHSVSVMVVQAGAADQLLAAGSAASEPVRQIRETGRQALDELRRELGSLREGEAPPPPVPSLSDLERLVTEAGARLEADLPPGLVAEVPPGTGLTAYRVAQEALTNARRHAVGALVTVRLTCLDGALELKVTSGPPTSAPDGSGGGHGLPGMRERVEMYAGELDAGPTPDGGWLVRALLPLEGSVSAVVAS